MMNESKALTAMDLYIGYELLTLLSTLYSKAYNCEYLDERKQGWNHSIDLVIEDVETFYEIWQSVEEELTYGLPLQENNELKAFGCKLKRRFTHLQRCFHDWTILRRLPSLLKKCENKLQALLLLFMEAYPCDQSHLKKLMQSGQLRLKQLQKLEKHFDDESIAIKA